MNTQEFIQSVGSELVLGVFGFLLIQVFKQATQKLTSELSEVKESIKTLNNTIADVRVLVGVLTTQVNSQGERITRLEDRERD